MKGATEILFETYYMLEILMKNKWSLKLSAFYKPSLLALLCLLWLLLCLGLPETQTKTHAVKAAYQCLQTAHLQKEKGKKKKRKGKETKHTSM